MNTLNNDFSDISSSDEDDKSLHSNNEDEIVGILTEVDPILKNVILDEDGPSDNLLLEKAKIKSSTNSCSLDAFKAKNKNYDMNLMKNLKRIQNLNNELNVYDNMKDLLNSNEIVRTREEFIRSQIMGPVPKQLLDYLVRDLAGTTLDWYLFTKPPVYKEPSLSDWFVGTHKMYELKELYIAFGASSSSLDLGFIIEDYRKHDQMINRVPIEIMCEELENHISTKDELELCTSLRYFILFILDRKVFESQAITSKWVYDIWQRHRLANKIEIYLSIVPRDCFFLHYRATRLLPIANELLVTLFPDPGSKSLMRQFDQFVDSNDWFQILYFILFVNSTNKLNRNILLYFKNCIYDMNNDNISSVELSLLKSYVNVFAGSN